MFDWSKKFCNNEFGAVFRYSSFYTFYKSRKEMVNLFTYKIQLKQKYSEEKRTVSVELLPKSNRCIIYEGSLKSS
jgi:hypothetical protein